MFSEPPTCWVSSLNEIVEKIPNIESLSLKSDSRGNNLCEYQNSISKLLHLKHLWFKNDFLISYGNSFVFDFRIISTIIENNSNLEEISLRCKKKKKNKF